MADTTILILSVDEADRLRYSVPAAMRQEGARVVVIDNASTDGTERVAREHGADCVRLPERTTYCAAINAGIAGTDGDAVLLLNADCVLAPGFLAAARPHLDQSGVGSVSGCLLRLTTLEEGQCLDRVDTVGVAMRRSRKNLLEGYDSRPDTWSTPTEVFGPDGAAALYRRETLDDCAVDGAVLDEDFESWASDVDLAWRARLLGWRCVYEPLAVGHHVRTYRPETRDGMPPRARSLVFRNRYLMIAKNEVFGGLWRDLHHVLAYEVLVLGYALLREPQLLSGYVEAIRLLPRAWRQRSVIQARRRARGLARLRPSGYGPSDPGLTPLLAVRPGIRRLQRRQPVPVDGQVSAGQGSPLA